MVVIGLFAINVILILCIIMNLNSRTAIRNFLRDPLNTTFRTVAPNGTREVLVVGDSLVSGAGGLPGSSFPEVLSLILGCKIRVLAKGGAPSSEIRELVKKKVRPKRFAVAVIWVGRNNYEDAKAVLDDMKAIIDHIDPDFPPIVLSIINGDFDGERSGGAKLKLIIDVNTELASTYSKNFIDIRASLLSSTRLDADNYFANPDPDLISPRLRSDAIHLNDLGYRMVAIEVAKKILLLIDRCASMPRE